MNEIDKLSDVELVALTIQNQDEFLHIVNRYKLRLFRYVKRISRLSDEDVEDVLQEVFLKIYLNLNDFDNSLKFSSWVYAIAHNQVISNHRKLKARAEGYAVAIDNDLADTLLSRFDTAKDLDLALSRQRINETLAQLPDKYREVLILRFLEQKSYAEISDIIKKPSGTVASMLNKAKLKFRQQFGELKDF